MIFNCDLEKTKIIMSEYYWMLHKHLGGQLKTTKPLSHANCSLNRYSDPGPKKRVTDMLPTVPHSLLGNYRRPARMPSFYV
jgi:hypothetical protein